MQGNIIALTFGLSLLISSHVVCLSISDRSLEEISASAAREYKLHACGRALSAIKNFQEFGKIAVSEHHLPAQQINDTLSFIEGALKQRHQDLFTITENHCVEQVNGTKAAALTLRNKAGTRKNTPNYSYRLL